MCEAPGSVPSIAKNKEKEKKNIHCSGKKGVL
jgi:hypothetical protein